MARATGWVRGRWNVLRARRPRVAGAVESGVLGLRGTAYLLDEVRALRTRVAELERDTALLSAHVAALGSAAPVTDAQPAPSLEAARLSAVAFYEHRIAALEAGATGPRGRRHARAAAARSTDPRTSGVQQENEA